MKNKTFVIGLWFLLMPFLGKTQDTLRLSGQLIAWEHYNPNNELSLLTGGRYIPQLNYGINFENKQLLDLEISANMYGTVGIRPFDSLATSGRVKPYRFWLRYSSKQFEFRLGLQKINFGSASILRPLMWFDQLDPRDPLQLTDGVWGALARYYFLNNANVWLWTLYGNTNTKGWEAVQTNKHLPEFGGRFQFPLLSGEAAFTYHHRTADSRNLENPMYQFAEIPENRFGFDARFDFVIGCWVEASWIKKEAQLGMLTNQEIFNVGMDYTFGLGNGLHITYEQLFAAYDATPFQFAQTLNLSLLSANYPIGLFDNLSLVVYYDWNNRAGYHFINWQKQFNQITLYLMAYANPKTYAIPTQTSAENPYVGTGIQFMLVFNY